MSNAGCRMPNAPFADRRSKRAASQRGGFTLVELLLGASILSVAIVALMGAFFGQSFLNAHARFLGAAMNDATRVLELIRQQNAGTGCTLPSARPPSGESWNAWFDANNAKSIDQPNKNTMELIAVTCQNEAGTVYCGPNQTGRLEWTPWYNAAAHGGVAAANSNEPIIRVTVAVGWRQQQRNIGQAGAGSEFSYVTEVRGKNPPTEVFRIGPDADADGVIESQALLTTLVACR